MGITIRHYIVAEEGPLRRVPRGIVEDLVFGKDALPEFAGTRQRVAAAVIENEGSKPFRILDVRGTYWHFDDNGRIDAGLAASFGDWMDSANRSRHRGTGKVVSLVPEIKQRQVEARHRWDVSADEIDRIAADLWPGINGAAVDVTTVKGVKPKRPALTYDAKAALQKIGPLLANIDNILQDLSETGLKSLAFEARRSATHDDDGPLWNGVAAVCERHREIKARQRTGKGAWYAVVEAWRWEDQSRRISDCYTVAHERCDGKKAAVVAARRLLRDHADTFSEDIWLECFVKSELEWQPEAP